MRRLLFVVVSGTALLACGGPRRLVEGNGQVDEVTRSLSGVRALALATVGDALVVLGQESSVRIRAEDNLLPYLTSEVDGDVLGLGTARDVDLRPTKPIAYTVTVPGLRAITTASLGSVHAPPLVASAFELAVSSAGGIHLAALRATTLDVTLSSVGGAQVDDGEVRSECITVSSSGSFVGTGLKAATAEVSISSSGHVLVWVTDRLDVSLTSSGSVRYLGSPVVTSHVSSSGTVAPLGER